VTRETAGLQRRSFEAFYSRAAAVQINNLFHLMLAVVWPLALAAAPAQPAVEAKRPRVALVIGNNRYENSIGALRNTVHDAEAMAKALRALGFTVIEKHNVTRDELMAALLQFRAKLGRAEVGVFYFAGHGISVAASNYLIPIKSNYSPGGQTDAELRLLAETKLFNAEEAVAEMTDARAGCNVIILDACRTTPAARNPRTRDAANAGGLAEMNPPAGSLVAFATDAGHAAADGDGSNGLYTEELIKHLLTPGLSIEQVFKRTRAGVMERSGGAQIPAEYSRLVGEDILLAGPAPAKPAEEAIPKAEPIPVPTLAQINKLAAAGNVAGCIDALRYYTRSDGPDSHTAAPLGTLLEAVKESLRDGKTAAANAGAALQNCELILPAVNDCLPPGDAQRTALTAKADNRRGDALLLLGRAEDALAAFNAAAELTPDDGYILYNRGRAFLALDRKDEAKADFTAAASAKFKRSGVRKLAAEALAAMK
jgi:Caspase domain